jgi:hypothetical protein
MKTVCNPICSTCVPYLDDPALCVDCQKGTPCTSVYTTDCVIYNSDDLLCYGVEKGFTLTEVLLVLLEFVFPECHAVPTTTTTSTSTTSTTTTSSTTTTTSTTTICPTTSTTTKYRICKTCPH